MIEAFYLVKDSGLPVYTYHRGDKKEFMLDDLIAPFLTAIDMFSRENFHGRIKAIVLEDGRKLYFRSFKLNNTERSIRFIAVTTCSFENISLLDSKMINLKWMMEKIGRYLADGAVVIPATIQAELVEKIKDLIESFPLEEDSQHAQGREETRTRRGSMLAVPRPC